MSCGGDGKTVTEKTKEKRAQGGRRRKSALRAETHQHQEMNEKRKVLKLEKQHSDEHPPAKADGPEGDQQTSGNERKGLMNEPRKESGAQKKLRKAINREKREQKTKACKEREAAKAKKKKEGEEKLRRRGEMLTRKQPKISGWFRNARAGTNEKGEAFRRRPKVKDMAT